MLGAACSGGGRSARRRAPGSAGTRRRGCGSSARRSAPGSRRSGRRPCCRARSRCRAPAAPGCPRRPRRRLGDCEPKISIMPITVPSRPSSGAAEAMVASARQVALEPVRHDAAGGLHGGAQVVLGGARVGVQRAEAAASTSPSAELLLQLGHDVRAREPTTRDTVMASSSSLGGSDLGGLEADEALDDERQRQHGTGEQRPDRPTRGNYDRKQERSSGADGTANARRLSHSSRLQL